MKRKKSGSKNYRGFFGLSVIILSIIMGAMALKYFKYYHKMYSAGCPKAYKEYLSCKKDCKQYCQKVMVENPKSYNDMWECYSLCKAQNCKKNYHRDCCREKCQTVDKKRACRADCKKLFGQKASREHRNK